MSKGDANRTKDRDAYRKTLERIRKNEALQELATQAQELNMGYEDQKQNKKAQ